MQDNFQFQSVAVDVELHQKLDKITFLLESISGALIEITWVLKATFVIFIVLSAWRLVRR